MPDPPRPPPTPVLPAGPSALADGAHTFSDGSGGKVHASFVSGHLHGPFSLTDQAGHATLIATYTAGLLDGARELFVGNRLVSRTPYRANRIEGVVELFHPNGNLAAHQPFLAGLQHGLTLFYDDAGTLTRECPYLLGRVQGQARSFYDDGKTVQLVEHFEDDLRHGEARTFAPDGALLQTVRYEKGKPLATVRTGTTHPSLLRSIFKRR